MRTTIIPAQITTVEDRIAGSLTMTQIVILMAPVLWTAIIYIFLAPNMKLSAFKIMFIIMSIAVSGILVLRIKDKIVAEWLGVLFTYQVRPKYYLFNKNDLTSRTLDIPKISLVSVACTAQAKQPIRIKDTDIALSDLIKFEHLVRSGKVALHYELRNT